MRRSRNEQGCKRRLTITINREMPGIKKSTEGSKIKDRINLGEKRQLVYSQRR